MDAALILRRPMSWQGSHGLPWQSWEVEIGAIVFAWLRQSTQPTSKPYSQTRLKRKSASRSLEVVVFAP